MYVTVWSCMIMWGNIWNYGSKEDMASIENIGNVGNKGKTGKIGKIGIKGKVREILNSGKFVFSCVVMFDSVR